MTTLTIIRTAAVWIGLVWTGIRLWATPDSRLLRAIFACLAIVTLSSIVSLLASGPHPFGLKGSLINGIQGVLLLGGAYCVLAAFVAASRDKPGKYLAIQGLFIVAAATATMTFAALVPGDATVGDYTNLSAARMYVCSELSTALVLGCTAIESHRAATGAQRVQARALAIVTLGLALLSLALFALSSVHLINLSGGGYQYRLAKIGGAGMLIAGLVFVLGLCYAAIVMRFHDIRSWTRNIRNYGQLGPLWQLLHHAFPRNHLRRGAMTSPLAGWLPRGAQRRYYRRHIECLDGVVRISGYLPHPVNDQDFDRRAEALITAAHIVPQTESESSRPGPVGNLPISGGGTFNEGRDELIELSQAIRRHRNNTTPKKGAPWPSSSERASRA